MDIYGWSFYILVVPGIHKDGRDAQWYCGVTQDFARRFRQHNSGQVTATRGRQWQKRLVLSGFTQQEAFRFERYMKTGDTRDKRHRLLYHASAPDFQRDNIREELWRYFSEYKRPWEGVKPREIMEPRMWKEGDPVYRCDTEDDLL